MNVQTGTLNKSNSIHLLRVASDGRLMASLCGKHRPDTVQAVNLPATCKKCQQALARFQREG